MADLRGFDANQVEPSTAFEAIPAGKYLAVISESEMKPTKSGSGHYLQLAFQILEGEFKNRVFWARLNLDNPNPIAVRMAQAELSAICRSVGVLAPNDSVELHNLPLVIHVRCKKRSDTGEITNEIKGYEKKESTPPPITAATTNGTPPWKR
jgi:Protein of unknown function (DUF669)